MFWKKITSILNQSKTLQSSNTATPKRTRPTFAPERIGELGEHKIEVQLRQFSNGNRYFNDLLIVNPRSKTGYAQIDHVLITTYAIFVIETKNYKGFIRGKREDSSWRVNSKYNMYNPLRQNRTHINVLKRLLKECGDLRFISVVSFTKRCELHIDPDLRTVDTDEFVVYDILLTEFIERKLIRLRHEYSSPLLSDSDISSIFQVFCEKNITDPTVRKEHDKKASELKRAH